jgi:hypothetical protein
MRFVPGEKLWVSAVFLIISANGGSVGNGAPKSSLSSAAVRSQNPLRNRANVPLAPSVSAYFYINLPRPVCGHINNERKAVCHPEPARNASRAEGSRAAFFAA